MHLLHRLGAWRWGQGRYLRLLAGSQHASHNLLPLLLNNMQVGGVALGAGALLAVTGGLAAPAIAAGLGATVAAFGGGAAVGATVAGTVGSVAGTAALAGGLGAYGANAARVHTQALMAGVKDFGYIDLESVKESVGQGGGAGNRAWLGEGPSAEPCEGESRWESGSEPQLGSGFTQPGLSHGGASEQGGLVKGTGGGGGSSKWAQGHDTDSPRSGGWGGGGIDSRSGSGSCLQLLPPSPREAQPPPAPDQLPGRLLPLPLVDSRVEDGAASVTIAVNGWVSQLSDFVTPWEQCPNCFGNRCGGVAAGGAYQKAPEGAGMGGRVPLLAFV